MSSFGSRWRHVHHVGRRLMGEGRGEEREKGTREEVSDEVKSLALLSDACLDCSIFHPMSNSHTFICMG